MPSPLLSVLVLAVLCLSCANCQRPTPKPSTPAIVHYSYSRAVGGGSGTSFSSDGVGRITAIRVWEISHAYITGIQLRYENTWSKMIGRVVGRVKELMLFDNEVIVQISGKHDNSYIYQVIFVTCLGRSLIVGQPLKESFNFYPIHVDAELRLLSGRFNGRGITSLAAHWGVVYMDKKKRFTKIWNKH